MRVRLLIPTFPKPKNKNKKRNMRTIPRRCVSGDKNKTKCTYDCLYVRFRSGGGSKGVLVARSGVLVALETCWRVETCAGGLLWGVGGSRRMVVDQYGVWVAQDA